MRIDGIYNADLQNGQGVGVTIGTCGCPFKCDHCFNKRAWDFNSGQEFTEELEQKILDLLKPKYINHLSVIGGEPLIPQNIHELNSLFSKIKQTYFTKKIWVWTGYEFEDILAIAYGRKEDSHFSWSESDKRALRNVLANIDVLVDGPFIQEQKDLTLKWKGSANQRVIDMNRTRHDSTLHSKLEITTL